VISSHSPGSFCEIGMSTYGGAVDVYIHEMALGLELYWWFVSNRFVSSFVGLCLV